MKLLKDFTVLSVILLFAVGVHIKAHAEIQPKAEVTPKSNSKKKSTDMSFDDLLIQGKYHFSDEQVTTVEDDKVLDALLGVRKDFKDRLKQSASRN